MDWPEAADRALSAGMATFGRSVTYTPRSGGPAFTLVGILGREHEEVLLDQVAVSTNRPVLGVRLADFSVPPVRSVCTDSGVVASASQTLTYALFGVYTGKQKCLITQ